MTEKSLRQGHAQLVENIFSAIAPCYDSLNTVFSFGIDRYWRKCLVDSIALQSQGAGSHVLDLAAGTMKVANQIIGAYPCAKVVAIDFCRPMLEKGMKQLSSLQAQHISPAVGNALQIPLHDASVDAITIAFGLRNIQPRQQALTEMFRVLKPGGKLSILELGTARTKLCFGIYNLYLRYVMPTIAKVCLRRYGEYAYLAESLHQYPYADVIAAELRDTGFSAVRYQRLTCGIAYVHEGIKHT